MTENQTVSARVSDRTLILTVLAIALLARLPLAFFEFARHPDEIWQYLEPAYRLDYGRGIITWEYRAGIRSWLIPALLAGPLALGNLLLGGTPFFMVPLRLCVIALSLVIVWGGMQLAWRISRLHAVVTGLVLATAFEPVLMAGQALSETFGTVFLVWAAALLTGHDRGGGARWLFGGLLAGLAVSARLQFGPAAVTLVLMTCGLNGRKWLWTVAGGVAGLAIDGLCDVFCGEMPLRWMVENFRLNLVQNVSAQYGVESAFWYLVGLARAGGPVVPLLLLFIGFGARRQPVLLAVALVNLLLHSAIPHKEFRFIFPSIVLLTITGAVGSADLLAWVMARYRRWQLPAIGGVAAVWLAASASAALQARRDHVFSFHSEAAMWRAIHGAPKVCGVASFDLGPLTMAQAYIDRPIPTYLFWPGRTDAALLRNSKAFDIILARQTRAPFLASGGYRLIACFPSSGERAAGPAAPRRLCLFRRNGGCDPAGAEQHFENEVRRRLKI